MLYSFLQNEITMFYIVKSGVDRGFQVTINRNTYMKIGDPLAWDRHSRNQTLIHVLRSDFLMLEPLHLNATLKVKNFNEISLHFLSIVPKL